MQICKNSRRDFNYSLQYALYSGDKNHLWYLNCWWSFEIEFKMVFALVKKFVVLNLAGAWIDNGILVFCWRWWWLQLHIWIMQSIEWWIYRKINSILYLSYISNMQAFFNPKSMSLEILRILIWTVTSISIFTLLFVWII